MEGKPDSKEEPLPSWHGHQRQLFMAVPSFIYTGSGGCSTALLEHQRPADKFHKKEEYGK